MESLQHSSLENAYPTPDNTPQRVRTAPREPTTSQTLPRAFIVPQFFQQPRRFKIGRNGTSNLAAALNKPTIRRLARRGGIKRINQSIYQTIQQVIKERLRLVLSKAILITTHTNRKTLTSLDVVYALQQLGTPVYGFGMIEKGDKIPCRASYYKIQKKKKAKNKARIDQEMQMEREREERRVRMERVDRALGAMRRGVR